VSASESWPGQKPAEVQDEEEEAVGGYDGVAQIEPDEEDEPDELDDDEEEEPEEAEEDDDGGGDAEDEEPQLRLAGHAPGDLDLPDDVDVLEGEPRGTRRGVGIVASRFNGDITNRLLESALAELDSASISRASITVMAVPGAFELPLGAMALAKTRRYSCIVALGCVIRGETAHFDYICAEAASGLQLAALETGVPVAFGVLTVDTLQQAMARVDKGAEAVRTALEMADLFTQLRSTAAQAR
jgi:6,7-dimethyl-8-ribityllumazine synthase